MIKYTDVISEQDIINKYDYIEYKNNSNISMGMKHINNVIDICKKLSTILELDEETKNNLLIAAALHDIGKISDIKDHNYQSFNYSFDYLRYRVDTKSRNIITGTILRHSNESEGLLENLLSLANALDITRKRLLDPFKLEDNLHNKIKDIEISKEADNIIINIIGVNSLIIDEISNIDKIISYLDNICNNYDLNYKILINNKDILLESKVKV